MMAADRQIHKETPSSEKVPQGWNRVEKPPDLRGPGGRRDTLLNSLCARTGAIATVRRNKPCNRVKNRWRPQKVPAGCVFHAPGQCKNQH
jgi:hypothetical protein